MGHKCCRAKDLETSEVYHAWVVTFSRGKVAVDFSSCFPYNVSVLQGGTVFDQSLAGVVSLLFKLKLSF